MPSSTSSSDPWRRFAATLAAASAGLCALVFLFVALVDPWGTLPLSLPITRWPVDGDARYAFPALARNPDYDSAVIGNSTSRLLRPALLDALLGGRFANLAMNAATAYEQSAILGVFIAAHPRAQSVAIGLDVVWCHTEPRMTRDTARPFPTWMYERGRWAGYAHMFDLHAVQTAGQAFAEFAGLKPRVYGIDGYTRFTPPDETYDAARAEAHMREWSTFVPAGRRDGPPEGWTFPALDVLRGRLEALPAEARKILFFTPYNRAVLPKPGEDGAASAWAECKRRVASIARDVANTTLADFMFASPLTSDDTNYWDGLHYRQPVADRLARDLARAAKGEAVADDSMRVIVRPPAPQGFSDRS